MAERREGMPDPTPKEGTPENVKCQRCGRLLLDFSRPFAEECVHDCVAVPGGLVCGGMGCEHAATAERVYRFGAWEACYRNGDWFIRESSEITGPDKLDPWSEIKTSELDDACHRIASLEEEVGRLRVEARALWNAHDVAQLDASSAARERARMREAVLACLDEPDRTVVQIRLRAALGESR